VLRVSSLDFRLTSAELADGSYVVTVGGEVDTFAAPRLERELEKRSAGTQGLIVDLLEVPFVESAILGVLLTAARRLRARGAELVLVADNAGVLRTLDTTGLTGQFRLERSLATAIEWSVAHPHHA
jgi:anti-anti-sigma factor